MQLKTLVLEDFLSYKSETVEFPVGLVAVVGHNHDSMGAGSNGGGKSALFDAVSWALYGKTLRDIGIDDVIRVGAKSCEVALAFEIDGEKYYVHRKRGRSTELVFTRGTTDLSQSQLALTQEKIDQTLGMDYRMFRVVATFQGDALRFAGATDKEQKEILEKLMGLEDYALAQERARKELNQLVPSITVKQQQVDQETGLLKIRKDEILKLQLQQDEARRKAQEIIQGLMHKGTAIHDGIARNNAEINENKRLRIEQESRLATVSSSNDDAYRELAEAQSNHRATLQKIQSASLAKVEQERRLAKAQERIGTPCGECQRPIEEAQVVPLMESVAEKILAAIDEITAERAKLATIELQVDAASHKVEAEKKANQEAAARRGQIVAEIQKLNRRNEQLEGDNRELAVLLEQHKRSKVEQEAVIQTFDARIKDAQTRLTEAEALIVQRTAEVTTERERAEYLKFWDRGFGLQGIRSMLLDGIAEKLTDQTNRYLKTLSGGTQWCEFTTQSTTKDGESREKFQVRVFNQHGASTYQGNSAGERKRVDLAVALALHHLARSRASRALGFAILDEIFECLDEVGCDAVVNLLRAEKDQLGTIFVVSHNPAMGTRFGATIEVAKKDGVTTLVRREQAAPACEKSKPESTSPKTAKSAKRARKTSSAPTKATSTPEPSKATSSSP